MWHNNQIWPNRIQQAKIHQKLTIHIHAAKKSQILFDSIFCHIPNRTNYIFLLVRLLKHLAYATI